MGILDSFYLQFGSNAKETKKDVDALDKSTKDFTDQVNKTDDQTAKLGLTFSKLARAGVEFFTAYASFSALKAGINDAIDYNAKLEKTSKLTGINARELTIWNDVIARAGGSPSSQQFLDFITQLNSQYANLGINDRIPLVTRDLFNLSKQIHDLGDVAGYAFAQKLGIPDDVFLALKDGPTVLQANIDKMKALDNANQATAKSAYDLKQAEAELAVQGRSTFTDLIPLASKVLEIFQLMAKGWRVLFGVVETIGGIGQGGHLLNIAPDLKKMLHDDFGVGSPEVSSAPAKASATPKSPVNASSNQNESREFWKAQGYNAAQVAALLANEQAEGGFSDNAVGDNGEARGIFQWHAARRKKILEATGIDVTSSSHADQLRAAAWELQQTGTANNLRNAQSPAAAAAILTGYEAPANPNQQAYLRGVSADSFYNKDKANVQIDNITINTQATDANGIAAALHQSLNQHMSTVVGQYDDGVDR